MQLDGALQFPNVINEILLITFAKHFYFKCLHMYLEEGGKRVKKYKWNKYIVAKHFYKYSH